MKERPISMSAWSVQRILEGAKTMTRRVSGCLKYVNENPNDWREKDGVLIDCTTGEVIDWEKTCPYGLAGDRLWVRETWKYSEHDVSSTLEESLTRRPTVFYYASDNLRYRDKEKWKSPRYMFRKDSRILLELTEVRVERTQGISEDDCIREGCDMETNHGSLCIDIEDDSRYENDLIDGSAVKTVFKKLWDSIYEKKGSGWTENPYCWVLGFKVVE